MAETGTNEKAVGKPFCRVSLIQLLSAIFAAAETFVFSGCGGEWQTLILIETIRSHSVERGIVCVELPSRICNV
jgi:hypothetical protein